MVAEQFFIYFYEKTIEFLVKLIIIYSVNNIYNNESVIYLFFIVSLRRDTLIGGPECA